MAKKGEGKAVTYRPFLTAFTASGVLFRHIHIYI
jgi:hypothetical protein